MSPGGLLGGLDMRGFFRRGHMIEIKTHGELEAMRAEGVLNQADLPAVLERLSRRHPVAVHYIIGHWLDVDTPADLAEARNFS